MKFFILFPNENENFHAVIRRQKEQTTKWLIMSKVSKYSVLSQTEVESKPNYKHSLNFNKSSKDSYSEANKVKSHYDSHLTISPEWSGDTDIDTGSIFSNVISRLVLVFSYLLVFFTLPISVWFCFKNLPHWERLVVYRLGKFHGVKGPGNIFIFPWLDKCTKLDLRTKLIAYPTKQVILHLRLLLISKLFKVTN